MTLEYNLWNMIRFMQHLLSIIKSASLFQDSMEEKPTGFQKLPLQNIHRNMVSFSEKKSQVQRRSSDCFDPDEHLFCWNWKVYFKFITLLSSASWSKVNFGG